MIFHDNDNQKMFDWIRGWFLCAYIQMTVCLLNWPCSCWVPQRLRWWCRISSLESRWKEERERKSPEWLISDRVSCWSMYSSEVRNECIRVFVCGVRESLSWCDRVKGLKGESVSCKHNYPHTVNPQEDSHPSVHHYYIQTWHLSVNNSPGNYCGVALK